MWIKDRLIRLIGESNAGRLEYHLHPNRGEKWGGAFNGQQFRREIFHDLVAHFDFDAILETGTYRGVTTKYFCQTGLPIHTVEASARYLAFAQANVRKVDENVHFYHSDSRTFLQDLGKNDTIGGKQPFIYLDAHWYQDLPLREELEIVQQFWPGAVVMVDDFAVPGTGYGFDDYGNGKALTLDYLSSLTPTSLEAFFPAVDETRETGCRRGCVILGSDGVATQLRSIKSLRHHGPVGNAPLGSDQSPSTSEVHGQAA